MKLVDLKCPHCGARLEVDADNNVATCEYCGAELLIEKELPERESTPFEYQTNAPAATTPKKRRTWLWVLGWIFVFPVPLTIILLRKTELKTPLRYGLIVLGWVLYFLIVIYGGDDTNSQYASTTMESPISIVINCSNSQPAEI